MYAVSEITWASILMSSMKSTKCTTTKTSLSKIGSGNVDDPLSVGQDLALLAMSNHTIVSRGMYF